MLSESQRKRPQAESKEEPNARVATLSENQRKRLKSESTEMRESRLSSSKKWKKVRLVNESEQERTLRLEREKEQARLRMQAWRRKKQHVKCNSQEATFAGSVPCTRSSSQGEENVTSINVDCKLTDGLQSDSVKEIHSRQTLCDDSVMDGSIKQDLSCQNSEQEMERDESVNESAVVTESILRNPVLQIAVPYKQDDKMRNNRQEFERVILVGPTHKCHSCEKLCYGTLGAIYSLQAVNELLTVMDKPVEKSVESVWFCNRCKNALQRRKFHQDHSLIE